MAPLRTRLPRATAAAATFLLCATGSGGQTPASAHLPRDLVGCYALTLRQWILPKGRIEAGDAAPRVIALDSMPVEDGWRLMLEAANPRGGPTPHARRWRMTRDTVEFALPSDSTPTLVLLARIAAGALTGYAIAGSDTRVARTARWPVAAADARRIACDADQRPHGTARDSARLVDDRLVIEPLGVSLRLPPVWMGVPSASKGPFRTCEHNPEGTLEERVHTNRRLLPVLRHAYGEWKKEFSAVVDSVAPFDALVARAGGGRWGLGGFCGLALQMRVYVGDFSLEWLASRAATVGARTARRFFQPVERIAIDTAGWRGIRLSWNAWYYDYGGTAYVDFLARRVRDRTIALVFTYVRGSEEQLAQRAVVLESFEERR